MARAAIHGLQSLIYRLWHHCPDLISDGGELVGWINQSHQAPLSELPARRRDGSSWYGHYLSLLSALERMGRRTDWWAYYGPSAETLARLAYRNRDTRWVIAHWERYGVSGVLPRSRREHRAWPIIQEMIPASDDNLSVRRQIIRQWPRWDHATRIRVRSNVRACAQYYRPLKWDVVTAPVDWRHVSRREAWVLCHGRVPRDESVIEALPVSIIRTLRVKHWMRIMGSIRDEHHILAAARLSATWAAQEIDSLRRKTDLSIHDLGINLPDEPLTPDRKKYLTRHCRRWAAAVRVVASWDSLPAEIDVWRKGMLDEALAWIAAQVYDDVDPRAQELAAEAARWSVDQDDYIRHQARWLSALDNRDRETIPGGWSIEHDGYRCYLLDADDPRALYVGHHTGCCQHPGGAGSDCAWRSVESDRVLVVERHGRVIAQSWVWRSDNAIICDNIECPGGAAPADRAEIIRDLYRQAAGMMTGKLEVNAVYVGTGYADVTWDDDSISRPVPGPGCYNDSDRVWRIA